MRKVFATEGVPDEAGVTIMPGALKMPYIMPRVFAGYDVSLPHIGQCRNFERNEKGELSVEIKLFPDTHYDLRYMDAGYVAARVQQHEDMDGRFVTDGNVIAICLTFKEAKAAKPKNQTKDEFLLARIQEVETTLDQQWGPVPDSVRTMCANQRALIEWHAKWPILLENKPEFSKIDKQGKSTTEVMGIFYSQTFEWVSHQEYVRRFGKEAPASPVVRTWLESYRDHPDFKEEWLS